LYLEVHNHINEDMFVMNLLIFLEFEEFNFEGMLLIRIVPSLFQLEISYLNIKIFYKIKK